MSEALEFKAQIISVKTRVDRSITISLNFGEDQAEAAQEFIRHIMGMCHGAVVFPETTKQEQDDSKRTKRPAF
jgi:hypothetical protein